MKIFEGENFSPTDLGFSQMHKIGNTCIDVTFVFL